MTEEQEDWDDYGEYIAEDEYFHRVRPVSCRECGLEINATQAQLVKSKWTLTKYRGNLCPRHLPTT